MIRVAIAGAAGRMGKTILKLAALDSDFQITAALEHSENPAVGQDIGPLLGQEPMGVLITTDAQEAAKEADVLIDFTHPSAAEFHLNAVLKHGAGYVLGTTGLDKKLAARLQAAAKKIPIVQSPNMSVGVNLLFKLAELAGSVLDENYDIEISEIHHRMKKDAPSGTAMKLLEILAAVRKKNLKKDVVYGRVGETGVRPKGKIGVFALRGGDVVGDHTLSFLGDGERIELIHRATSREAFAQGAVLAAKFLAKRKHGLYNMSQVLGIA